MWLWIKDSRMLWICCWSIGQAWSCAQMYSIGVSSSPYDAIVERSCCWRSLFSGRGHGTGSRRPSEVVAGCSASAARRSEGFGGRLCRRQFAALRVAFVKQANDAVTSDQTEGRAAALSTECHWRDALQCRSVKRRTDSTAHLWYLPMSMQQRLLQHVLL